MKISKQFSNNDYEYLQNGHPGSNNFHLTLDEASRKQCNVLMLTDSTNLPAEILEEVSQEENEAGNVPNIGGRNNGQIEVTSLSSEPVKSGSSEQDPALTLVVESSGDLLEDLELENGNSVLFPLSVVVIQNVAGDE